MSTIIYQVDAFTRHPFAGNPAGVCPLKAPADPEWMQQVAAEMNLSETAFLYPEDRRYHLRWFTPTVEVDLCGHATLASAHVLWEQGVVEAAADVRFDTRSGPLGARRVDGRIEMDFPATPPEPADAPPELADALGVIPVYTARSRFDYLVEVAGPDQVRRMAPDINRLKALAARGIMVTARSDRASYDFISRFFAPAAGVNEDPVTGSAHCCLGPYWAAKLKKNRLRGFQASARGGEVDVTVDGDRVLLGGRAVTVMRIELLA
jgi:PhzF family phenazine biosynthesis protein